MSWYRVSHAHSKHLDEEILLFREIAGINDHMVKTQRLAWPTATGADDAFHVGYQFSGIALGIAKPKQSGPTWRSGPTRLAIKVANAERHVREALDED
jgi:hypothetical protein